MAEPGADFESDDAEERFGEDAAGHLAGTELTVDEDDGYFFDTEAYFVGGIFHFDLEGVTLEADLIKFDGLEHMTAVADEAGCGVVYLNAEDEANVFAGEVGHEHASYWPIDDIDAGEVAATDGHVGVGIGDGVVELEQVLGVVGEVGIHFKYIFVFMLDCPAETSYIGCAETEFASAFDEEDAVGP